MVDWTKPIEFVDGNKVTWPAKLISREFRTESGANAFVVQIEGSLSSQLVFPKEDGITGPWTHIRNRKVKHEAWMNLHRDYNGTYEGGAVYKSEELARKEGRGLLSYVATIKIEWEE